MPTTLPTSTARPVRRLSLGETVRFLFLIAQVRLLDLRLSALYSGAERRGREPHGPTLLRLVRRWLAVHERIGALLPGIPEPPHVQQVRVVLGFLTERTWFQFRPWQGGKRLGLTRLDIASAPSRTHAHLNPVSWDGKAGAGVEAREEPDMLP